MSLVGDRVKEIGVTYTLIIVNFESEDKHPDRQFTSMNESEQFCDKEHAGWTSLVVTVLPRKIP